MLPPVCQSPHNPALRISPDVPFPAHGSFEAPGKRASRVEAGLHWLNVGLGGQWGWACPAVTPTCHLTSEPPPHPGGQTGCGACPAPPRPGAGQPCFPRLWPRVPVPRQKVLLAGPRGPTAHTMGCSAQRGAQRPSPRGPGAGREQAESPRALRPTGAGPALWSSGCVGRAWRRGGRKHMALLLSFPGLGACPASLPGGQEVVTSFPSTGQGQSPASS